MSSIHLGTWYLKAYCRDICMGLKWNVIYAHVECHFYKMNNYIFQSVFFSINFIHEWYRSNPSELISHFSIWLMAKWLLCSIFASCHIRTNQLATEISYERFLIYRQELKQQWLHTSHSAYVATETELDGAKIDGLLPPNIL